MIDTASAYRAGFIGRVRAARAAKYESTGDAAKVLGMEQAKYSKYEVRSFLPMELIERFCLVCQVSVQWLMTGTGPGPSWEPFVHVPKKRKSSKKKQRKAA